MCDLAGPALFLPRCVVRPAQAIKWAWPDRSPGRKRLPCGGRAPQVASSEVPFQRGAWGAPAAGAGNQARRVAHVHDLVFETSVGDEADAHLESRLSSAATAERQQARLAAVLADNVREAAAQHLTA